MNPAANFESLGLQLPPAPAPKGVYKPLLIVDKFVYVSGHGPVLPDGSLLNGKAGIDVNADGAKLAAQQVGLTILSTLVAQLGSLNKIKRVIKVLGMVNATPTIRVLLRIFPIIGNNPHRKVRTMMTMT